MPAQLFEQLSGVCDVPANGHLSAELRVASLGECRQRCIDEPLCRAFDTNGTACFLKRRCRGDAGACAGWCGWRQRPATRHHSLCALVARWGEWPPWTPLVLRLYASNADVRWTMLGDTAPAETLPNNVRFLEFTLDAVVKRLATTVGYSAGSLAMNNHSTSKISDLKPMFGEIFAKELDGCEFYANIQDDVLPGRLREWATTELLLNADVVSPLPAPFDSCGPVMIYRNSRPVSRLWRNSPDAARVLSDPKYLVFDEWWGPLRGRYNMPNVTRTEHLAGRVRVVNGGVDKRKRGNKKAWGWEDRLYSKAGVVWYDEAMVLTWSGGRLWQGVGPEASEAETARPPNGLDAYVPGAGFQLAFAHLTDTKRRAPLGRLRLSPRARKLVASASSFTLTRHGLFVAARRGRHVWLTGEVPGVHGIVRTAALRANFSRLQRLSGTRARVRVVDSHLPCVVDARFDNTSAALATAAARPARAAAFASAAHAKPC